MVSRCAPKSVPDPHDRICRDDDLLRVLALPTAIAGIYGMNFKNMPELETRYGYFAVLGTIALLLLYRFKGRLDLTRAGRTRFGADKGPCCRLPVFCAPESLGETWAADAHQNADAKVSRLEGCFRRQRVLNGGDQIRGIRTLATSAVKFSWDQNHRWSSYGIPARFMPSCSYWSMLGRPRKRPRKATGPRVRYPGSSGKGRSEPRR